jgi:hypothetical protein
MNKDRLKQLISEGIQEYKLKKMLRSLVIEAIQELKSEGDPKKGCNELMSELDSAVKSIDKDYTVTQDDAKIYNVCNCPPHMFKLKHMYEDKFNVTYIKDSTDRENKLGMSFEDAKKYIIEKLKSKDLNYVKQQYNKAAENSKPVEGKEEGPQKTKEKVEDAVKKEEDLPNAPFKKVEKITKQIDHNIKGNKVDYKYPKQDKKDKAHLIKLKGKKNGKK